MTVDSNASCTESTFLRVALEGGCRLALRRISGAAFRLGLLMAVTALIAACGPAPDSGNAAAMLATGSVKDAIRSAPAARDDGCLRSWTEGFLHPVSSRGGNGVPRSLVRARPIHTSGDVVRLDVVEGEEFSGTFKVNLDGYINIPFAGPVRAAGLTTPELVQALKRTFVDKGLLLAHRAELSVIPAEWAPIQIRVTGAVFQSGRGLINNADRPAALQQVVPLGDSPPGRFLDAGIRIAAGVRPDADLDRITIHRNGRAFEVDLSGVIDGSPVPDIYLMHGDHIEVPSTGCNQAALVRPSQITPKGIRVFISNVSVPLTGNLEQYSTNVPYGTRLLTAAISGNCVGGSRLTNSRRHVAHVANNPITGKSAVREVSVSRMLANPNDLDINPYLMPNDAIACYDSEVTNLREAARAVNEILTAVGLAITLF